MCFRCLEVEELYAGYFDWCLGIYESKNVARFFHPENEPITSTSTSFLS